MKLNARVAVVGGLALSLSLLGCLNKPATTQAPGLQKQDDLVVGAPGAMQGTQLKLTVLDRRPANVGYKVNYVTTQDWTKARFTLDKVAGGMTAVVSNVDPAVSAVDLTRKASHTFNDVAAGSGYRLKVDLIRLDANGVERIVATGTNTGPDGDGFIIQTGVNTVNVLLNLTADGRNAVTVPAPAASGGGGAATPTPSPNTLTSNVNTNSSFTGTRFAGMNSSGAFNAPNTLLGTNLGTAGGMEMGPDGTIYVASPSFHRILSLEPTAGSNTVAGTGSTTYNYDATNTQATTNALNNPQGMAMHAADGILYVCDAGNNAVRKIQGGVISTVAGRGASATITNGTSMATDVTLSSPSDVEIDADGSLYFTDTNRVCRVKPDGKIYTVATVTGARAVAMDRRATSKVLWVSTGTGIVAIPNHDVEASYPITPGAATVTFTNTTPLRSGTFQSLMGTNTWLVQSLAFDYSGTLYVGLDDNNGSYPRGALLRMPVTSTGSLADATATGRYLEVVAGATMNTAGVWLSGTNSNMTTYATGRGGIGGLLVDLRNAGSTVEPVNTLYWTHGGASHPFYANVLKMTLNGLTNSP